MKTPLVKCLYCDTEFQREEESYVQIGTRYAHLSCAESAPTWKDDTYKDRIFQYIQKIYGSYDYWSIDRCRSKWITENQYTNFGIYQTLIYAYEVKQLDPVKGGGRIGIVPYLYEEAKGYFIKFYLREKNITEAANSQLEQLPRLIIVEKAVITRKKEYSLDDVLVEE
jgi:hypothetical protein